MQRRYDLDWLRVIAFALLMLFHTGMMFSTWDWHIKNLETSQNFDLVMRFLHQWRMPLLFFISGSAVWFAMDRYSTWRYFLERQKRLLLPLVFGMLVVIPPQVYVERLFGHEQFDSLWDFYRTVFTTGSYPEGNLSWHHLWYVPYIWVFSMLTLPLFLLLRSASGRRFLERVFGWLARPWCLFLVFIPSAVSDILVRPFYPGDHMNLLADWGNFSHKLTFFIIGFALASGTRVYDVIACHRWKFLLAGLLSLLAFQLIWYSRWPFTGWLIPTYHLLSNFHIWMWVLALLGFGRHYLSFNHPVLRYANEAVYPFYILHQTVIVLIGYQLVYVNWWIPAKFAVVATGTFLVTWFIYAYAIKPFNLFRVVFGMKPQRGESRPIPPTAALITAEAATPAISRPAAVSSHPGDGGSAGRLSCLLLGGLALALLLGGCSRQEGRLVACTFSAPSLGANLLGISSNQQLAVYLPPTYELRSNRRFPVLYFLPNFDHNLWRYTGGSFQGFRLKEAMNRGIKRGQIEEMIVVIPNVNHWLGGSWYRNSPLTGNWEDYVVQDLTAYIDSRFRSIPSAESRALAGHGMGGFGALELGLKHPDLFGVVYALSPPLFDKTGLQDFGILKDNLLAFWHSSLEKWSRMNPKNARRAFRDFIQTRMNSPVRPAFIEALCISYAAAVSPDLALPYPHVALPQPGMAGARSAELATKFESGFGGWQHKLEAYQAEGRRLSSITIEYGGNADYEWIRHGAAHLSDLMRSLGIPHTLTAHDGGHDGGLGERLEHAMLPAISKSLKGETD